MKLSLTSATIFVQEIIFRLNLEMKNWKIIKILNSVLLMRFLIDCHILLKDNT